MKLVILMRTDLGMEKGKMIAQGAHATSRAVRLKTHESIHSAKGALSPWWADGEPKIVLKVASKEELQELVKKAGIAKLNTGMIIDKGLTKFQGIPTLTCGWIGPDTNEKINAITSKLKLL